MPDTIEVSDNYTVSSDTNISLHTTDQANGYVEIVGLDNNSHQFIVNASNDRAEFRDNNDAAQQAWFVDEVLTNPNSFAEVTVSAATSTGSEGSGTIMGVYLRSDAEGGGRGVLMEREGISGSGGFVRIQKVVAGVRTQLATFSLDFTNGVDIRLRLEVIDTLTANEIMVIAYVDGKPYIAIRFSESALYKKTGKVGIYAKRDSAWSSSHEIEIDDLSAGLLSIDIPEFVDSYIGETVKQDLFNHNLLYPATDNMESIDSDTMDLDNSINAAVAEDTGASEMFYFYRIDNALSVFSDTSQYGEVEVESNNVVLNNLKMGVALRNDGVTNKGLVASLDGDLTAANSDIILQLRTGVDSYTLLRSEPFPNITSNTKYVVRLECVDLTANQIECKIYVDEVLQFTEIVTDSDLFGLAGRPAIKARGGLNWNAGDKIIFHRFEAGILGSQDLEFAGSGNTSFDGSISIESHRIFHGSANTTFNGNVELHGGIVPFNGVVDASFDGSTVLNGLIREFGASVPVSFDSSITTLISQKLFSSDTASGVFGGSVNMEVSDFSFKWSLDNLEARTDYGFPTAYVDLDKDAIPVGAFPEGDFYERRLLQMPRLQEVELDTRFGISGFQRVTFTVDNSDRLISGLDLQDSFVRLLFVDDNGQVYKDFKGKVVDWTLSHQVTINVEDIEALAFTQDLPKRTLNDLIESEKVALGGPGQEQELAEFTNSVVADDLGKPIPIIFGRAIKVPLLYVKADETLIPPTQESKREYDYIIGEGTGLNSKFFQEVFTVYRDDQALDNFAGPQQGTAQGGSTNSITLDADHERPDGWFKYFWIFITSGAASGDIKFVDSYSNNIVTPDSSFSGNVNSGDTYELREWQFFDGSQTDPYPGYAFLRFKKRMGDRGRTEPLYADVNGLQDEVNVVRAVQSILTNSNWGFGLKVNMTSFDDAAMLPEITQMKCEGGILNTTSAGDLLRELLGFRDMVLTKIE